MARATGAVLLGFGVIALPVVGWGVGEDPGAEVAEALRTLGPPGVLWGRLIVDEESPLGAWTPVAGVQVTLYPATPALVSELERIRQSARDSGAQYESAVARVQEVLAVHQARLDGKSPETLGSDGALPAEPPLLSAPVARPVEAPPTVSNSLRRLLLPGRTGVVASPGQPTDVSSPHPWRQNTDPTGLFAFESLPSGDWLVVAVRIAAYGGQRLRAPPQQSGRGRGFLPRATGPAREAEIWVVRVRVGAAERVGLELTDRARWLAGPVR
jgi:hypothetical protein